MHVLALVQLSSDAPLIGLVGEIPGGVDGAAQRPVLLDRRGERVLLAFRRAQLADHERGGGVPAVHRRRDAQQIVPPVGDQLGVQPPGQQRPCQRMTRDELLGWAGAVEGDLAQVTDAGRELLADKIEQSKVGESGAVGVGGVLHDRQIGVVAEHAVEHVVALRAVATITLVSNVAC